MPLFGSRRRARPPAPLSSCRPHIDTRLITAAERRARRRWRCVAHFAIFIDGRRSPPRRAASSRVAAKARRARAKAGRRHGATVEGRRRRRCLPGQAISRIMNTSRRRPPAGAGDTRHRGRRFMTRCRKMLRRLAFSMVGRHYSGRAGLSHFFSARLAGASDIADMFEVKIVDTLPRLRADERISGVAPDYARRIGYIASIATRGDHCRSARASSLRAPGSLCRRRLGTIYPNFDCRCRHDMPSMICHQMPMTPRAPMTLTMTFCRATPPCLGEGRE